LLLVLCILQIVYGFDVITISKDSTSINADIVGGVKYPIYFVPAKIEGINGVGIGLYNKPSSIMKINGISVTLLNILPDSSSMTNGLTIEFIGGGVFFTTFSLDYIFDFYGYEKTVLDHAFIETINEYEYRGYKINGMSLSGSSNAISELNGLCFSSTVSFIANCYGVNISLLSSIINRELIGFNISTLSYINNLYGCQNGVYNKSS